MRFYLLADCDASLTDLELGQVETSLNEIIDTLNALQTNLYNVYGSGDSEVHLVRFGSSLVLNHAAQKGWICGSVPRVNLTKILKRLPKSNPKGSLTLLQRPLDWALDHHDQDVSSNFTDHHARFIYIVSRWRPLSETEIHVILEQRYPSPDDEPMCRIVKAGETGSVPPYWERYPMTGNVLLPNDILHWLDMLEYPESDPVEGKSATTPGVASAPSRTTSSQLVPSSITVRHLGQLLQGVTAGQVKLDHGEFMGGVIDQDVTVEGQSAQQTATLIGQDAPALELVRGTVALRYLALEAGSGGIALRRHPGVKLSVDGVVVRGRVEGIPGEQDPWDYPTEIDLPDLVGADASGQPAGVTTFAIYLQLAVACQASTRIDGVQVDLVPGDGQDWSHSTLILRVPGGRTGSVLFGYLELRSSYFIRRISLTARYIAQPSLPVTGVEILWLSELARRRLVQGPVGPSLGALAQGAVRLPVTRLRPAGALPSALEPAQLMRTATAGASSAPSPAAPVPSPPANVAQPAPQPVAQPVAKPTASFSPPVSAPIPTSGVPPSAPPAPAEDRSRKSTQSMPGSLFAPKVAPSASPGQPPAGTGTPSPPLAVNQPIVDPDQGHQFTRNAFKQEVCQLCGALRSMVTSQRSSCPKAKGATSIT